MLDKNEENAKRLRWKCRRGMLELDVLFSQFFEKKFSDLSVEEQQLFDIFLDESDPELFAWLLGHEKPEGAKYLSLIKTIQSVSVL
jgi:antitoxin CptB